MDIRAQWALEDTARDQKEEFDRVARKQAAQEAAALQENAQALQRGAKARHRIAVQHANKAYEAVCAL